MPPPLRAPNAHWHSRRASSRLRSCRARAASAWKAEATSTACEEASTVAKNVRFGPAWQRDHGLGTDLDRRHVDVDAQLLDVPQEHRCPCVPPALINAPDVGIGDPPPKNGTVIFLYSMTALRAGPHWSWPHRRRRSCWKGRRCARRSPASTRGFFFFCGDQAAPPSVTALALGRSRTHPIGWSGGRFDFGNHLPGLTRAPYRRSSR